MQCACTTARKSSTRYRPPRSIIIIMRVSHCRAVACLHAAWIQATALQYEKIVRLSELLLIFFALGNVYAPQGANSNQMQVLQLMINKLASCNCANFHNFFNDVFVFCLIILNLFTLKDGFLALNNLQVPGLQFKLTEVRLHYGADEVIWKKLEN